MFTLYRSGKVTVTRKFRTIIFTLIAVENKLPVENEWYCAFGLAFSVIWLFMKLFSLVIRVMAKKNK